MLDVLVVGGRFILNVEDFVYEQIFKGAINKGAKELHARDHAVMGLDDFKKGKIATKKSKKRTVANLIDERIDQAVKDSKK